MTIISYRPSDDQFWIACTKEEAEKWFVPLLDERGLRQYQDVLLTNEQRRQFEPESETKYNQIIKDAMGV